MRKYLFISSNEWPNWGGSELLWSAAAEKLVQRGTEVRVSVWDFAKTLQQVHRLQSQGCQFFFRKEPSLFSRFAHRVLPLPGYVDRHLRTIGRNMDLIVVSQGSNTDGLRWMEAALAAGLKYAVIAQGATEYSWADDEVAKRLARCYENASCAYFVSKSTLNLSRRQFATPLLNARIVRNPFNVRYDARPSWQGDPRDRLSLACVGRLETGTKGQDLLLEVLGRPQWRERNVRVSLVGKGLNERALRHMADELKLTTVDFAGHSNDIEQVWSRHHALVLPSRHEGMPLTVVEAMLCGRPCIATDVAGNRELIRDGVNGFLAKAPTVDLLDEVMSAAWNARDRLREMGETAATDVRKWVSKDPAEDFARELEALLD